MKIFVWVFLLVYSSAFGLSAKQARSILHLNPRHSVTFIDIKGYQQTTDYTCAPAAVMSILHYYKKLNFYQMNSQTEMKIAQEMGTTEAEGTDEHQIVAWLNNHGFRANVYYDGSIEKLCKYLDQGIPILVDWIDWGGHWVNVAGYDYATKQITTSRDTIFFADSAAHFANNNTQDGITSFNAERFLYMWFNSKHKNNIYIVAVPK